MPKLPLPSPDHVQSPEFCGLVIILREKDVNQEWVNGPEERCCAVQEGERRE